MEKASPLGKIKLVESLEHAEITPLEDFFRAAAQYLNSSSEYVRAAVSRFIATKFPLQFIFEPLIGVIVRDPVFWPAKQAAAMAFSRAPLEQLKPLLSDAYSRLNKNEQDELTEVLNSAGLKEILEGLETAADTFDEKSIEVKPEPVEQPIPVVEPEQVKQQVAAEPEAESCKINETVVPTGSGSAKSESSEAAPLKTEQTRRLKVLLSSLTNLDLNLSSEIAFALSNYSGTELLNSLVDMLHKQKSSFSRAILVHIVGMLENQDAVEFLLPYLEDEDRRVRANAVEAVGHLGGEKYARLLLPLLEDADNRVRANAARALWDFGGLRAVNILMNMLKDPRKWIRASGAYALGEIGVIHVIEPLLEAIDDPDIDVRVNVVRALGKTHDISVSKPMMRLVTHLDTPDEVRSTAVEALEQLRESLGHDFLTDLLQEPLLPDIVDQIKAIIKKRDKIILE